MAITDLDLSFTPIAGGAFPDGYASRMAGGYHIAATTAARNATPSYRLVEGMLCWVIAAGGSLWRLKASPWTGVDGDWEAAGAGEGVPSPAGVVGAVIIESDALGTRVARHLYQQDIAANFGISGFSVASTGRLAGALARRGDTLDTNTCAASYVSGPPTSIVLADSYTNGGSDFGGAWSLNTPFASGSRSSTIVGPGISGDPDPSWTITLTASLAGFSDQVLPTTVYWSSDVYWGSSATEDIANTDVYNGGLVGSFQSSLQRVRNQVRSFSGTDRYDWFLYPDQAAYTSGTPTFKDQSGFTFGTTDMGTVVITRNGVARTYRKIRSAGLLSSAFTVTVT